MSSKTPSTKEVEAVSWLVSRKIWASTAVIAGVFVVLIALTGVVLYDAPLMRGFRRSASNPIAVLYIVLFARALAFVLAQVRRDAAVARGDLSIVSDASLMGMTTVAAFSVIGVIATGVALPLLVATTDQFTYLAVGIAGLVVPVSYPILVYQLGQRTATDRYERGFHVLPAAWHYLWTLPVVVLVWYLALGVDPLPVTGDAARLFDAQTVFVDVWTLLYVAIGTPTLLVFLYPFRWYAERVVRVVLPS
ncbi:hypothetical protein [Salarchaeum japonicum]|uniref:Uncharacterized protein n=1 Tax=Salarchaeum japonicum TaxID=555573 RepID=A0AAV3T1D0_9EURY|nr:hypothetical protein [Salarchaeum japonicum]